MTRRARGKPLLPPQRRRRGKPAHPAGLWLVALFFFCQPCGVVLASFACGVASGDVTDRRAVIWTRPDQAGPIRAQVATDDSFKHVVFEAEVQAVQATDFAVQLDVDGLTPSVRYYYRFVQLDAPAATSAVGTLRTAPPPEQAVACRYVLSGDFNYAYAPFHALADAARQHPDLFIFFGDTIIADEPAGGLGVAHTLSEYHAKYRQNRSDPALRDLLAAVPLLVGWDDHEVVNDYAGGEPGPDLTPQRIAEAYRAFFDYMPLRGAGDPQDPFRTYRSIRYGSLAEFFLLDGRQYRARSAEQECGGDLDPFDLLFNGRSPNQECLAVLSEPRTYLGPAQMEWIKSALAASTATHKFVVADQPLSWIGLLPYDRWDGYDADRRELLEFVDAQQIENVWLLSTDVHMNAFAPDLTSYFRRYRSDYRLDNGVVVRGLMAGPIASQTLRTGALQTAAAVVGPLADSPFGQSLLNAAFDNMMLGIARANRWAFWDADRFAYAVVEVSPDEGVTVSYRGYDPAEQGEQPPDIHTLYDSTAPGYLPCWLWPGSAFVLVAPLATFAFRGRRRR